MQSRQPPYILPVPLVGTVPTLPYLRRRAPNLRHDPPVLLGEAATVPTPLTTLSPPVRPLRPLLLRRRKTPVSPLPTTRTLVPKVLLALLGKRIHPLGLLFVVRHLPARVLSLVRRTPQKTAPSTLSLLPPGILVSRVTLPISLSILRPAVHVPPVGLRASRRNRVPLRELTTLSRPAHDLSPPGWQLL